MPVSLDTSRIAVAGFSAGGYVARLAGIHAVPKPAAVVSAFGMGGDMLADALVFPRVHFPNPIPRAAAARILDDPSPEPSVNSPLSPDPQFGINDSNGRWLAGLWLASNGLFLDLLSGVEGLSEQLRALSTFEERTRLVFLPTFFYHGGADILVLPHESKKTYETLKQAGVETEMVVLPGAYHGMRDPSQPAQAMEGTEEIEMRAFDFLAKFLERD
ncbi:Alpha/Beta hydrolase protein [Flagelloscypha sp. PMI_526]|nr:Alpha/Beta hydrolase protein [Flagelloscypha sp. PMI_526]